MISDTCRIWLDYAKSDLDLAILAMSQIQSPRQRPYELILYHCQQTAEKALKSFIINSGVSYPYEHDLSVLRGMCAKFDNRFNSKRVVDHCVFLSAFCTVRYPDFALSVDASHADRGLNSAKRIFDFVLLRLGLEKIYYR